MWIASVDIGIKNFAFAILNLDKQMCDNFCFCPSVKDMAPCFDIIHFENINLVEGIASSKVDMMGVYKSVHEVLQSFHFLWKDCDVLLVEQQMQHRHASNIKALKISQHVIAHFMMHYPSKLICEFPAYHKTKVWNAPAKLKKHERKRWSINTVTALLSEKYPEDDDRLKDLRKKDDVADCILMCLAFMFHKK